MSGETYESEDQTRFKIQNLISMYEKSGSQKEIKQNPTSNKLSTRISDFAWPEKEVSHKPKEATEITISEYVSVKSLINVYQQISSQVVSPTVTRKDSMSKMKKNDNYLALQSEDNKGTFSSHDDSFSMRQEDPKEKRVIDSPVSDESSSTSNNVVGFSATSGLFDALSITEEEEKSSSFPDDKNEETEFDDDYSTTTNGFTPLPQSYSATRSANGSLSVILPTPKTKSNIKSGKKKNKKVDFVEEPTLFIETYNVYEYERGDESLDPVASSAQYEIEKKTEKLDKFTVNLVKGGKGLGLSIVGIGLGSETGEERLGIYIKALTPGGVAETGGTLKVQDQILEVDGISLVGVSQKFAGETLKATGQNVKFLIGREQVDENQCTPL